jgi:hypothetical protein
LSKGFETAHGPRAGLGQLHGLRPSSPPLAFRKK